MLFVYLLKVQVTFSIPDPGPSRSGKPHIPSINVFPWRSTNFSCSSMTNWVFHFMTLCMGEGGRGLMAFLYKSVSTQLNRMFNCSLINILNSYGHTFSDHLRELTSMDIKYGTEMINFSLMNTMHGSKMLYSHLFKVLYFHYLSVSYYINLPLNKYIFARWQVRN